MGQKQASLGQAVAATPILLHIAEQGFGVVGDGGSGVNGSALVIGY
jgi:hypothetical protein